MKLDFLMCYIYKNTREAPKRETNLEEGVRALFRCVLPFHLISSLYRLSILVTSPNSPHYRVTQLKSRRYRP
jgi:hypothetical protein